MFELAVGKGSLEEQNLEVFTAAIILDRNSQVHFHKAMLSAALGKTNCARNCALSAAE